MSAATPESIRPYVELLVAKAGTAAAPAFALATSDGWDGPPQLVVDHRYVDVRWCPSELAIREALVAELDAERALLLLTPITQLGEDVAARLFGRKVQRPDPQAALAAAFDVRALDAKIPSWLVRRLVALAPPGGYERTGARLLDADRAWSAFMRHGLGFTSDPNLEALLDWASSSRRERLLELDATARDDVVARLTTTIAGAVGVLAAVLAGDGDDVVALGLALRPLADGEDDAVQVTGRVHVGHHLSPWAFDAGVARAWAATAEASVRAALVADPAGAQATLQHADRWVERLEATTLAGASDVLSLGLRNRLAALGATVAARTGVEAAAAAVRRHRLADTTGATAVADLSRRLVAWLAHDEAQPATFRDAALAYATDDAYADHARTVLRHGGGEPTLDAALRTLVADADARRLVQEGAFAQQLAAWSAHAHTGDELLGVEDALATIVAPLARQRPVLVVVLDGMSHRVAVELLEDVVAEGWTELRRAAYPDRSLVVAALPSATTYSRTSLLSGKLARGIAADEQTAFAAHPDLRAASGAQPRLFHKREIADPHGGLSAALRTAIDSPEPVIGAVVNAIDDHLAKDDQLRSAWSVREIVPLRWLLDAARDATRLVVLLSDHGHVLERGGSLRPKGAVGGERWAAATRAAEQGEVLVEGPRVLVDGGRALLAWDETVRYAPKKHGYHGGASAQEVLVPAIVLAPTLPEPLDGFVEAPYDPPAWWTGITTAPVAAAASVVPPSPQPAPGQQLSMDAASASPTPASAPGWIDSLLASPTFAAQSARAARTPLSDERVRSILAALDVRDGTMLHAALAQAIGVAPARLGTTLAVLRLVLNVEGYDVLEVDDASDTVRLHRDVLFEQFGLAG
ncbi:MAG: hypothetical protein V7607_5873 [Solirubrobacteraceae bacterium]